LVEDDVKKRDAEAAIKRRNQKSDNQRKRSS